MNLGKMARPRRNREMPRELLTLLPDALGGIRPDAEPS